MHITMQPSANLHPNFDRILIVDSSVTDHRFARHRGARRPGRSARYGHIKVVYCFVTDQSICPDHLITILGELAVDDGSESDSPIGLGGFRFDDPTVSTSAALNAAVSVSATVATSLTISSGADASCAERSPALISTEHTSTQNT